jgi:S-DNA-T family DNA segregation ATPase FtsK/SpoIIIE
MVAKARKYGVTLLFATPVPSADSLPRKVAKVLSNRACFAIADHQGNDAILGTGKHKAGITATTLRPMTEDDGEIDMGDIGTAMTVGFMSIDSLLRCYYVARGSGVDEVTPVVQRALALREGAGITTTAQSVTSPAEQRDPLQDVAAVLGEQRRMRTQEVLQRLTERDRAGYGDWTFEKLTAVLTEHNAAPYKSNGVMQVSADLVRAAITERNDD